MRNFINLYYVNILCKLLAKIFSARFISFLSQCIIIRTYPIARILDCSQPAIVSNRENAGLSFRVEVIRAWNADKGVKSSQGCKVNQSVFGDRSSWNSPVLPMNTFANIMQCHMEFPMEWPRNVTFEKRSSRIFFVL